jgi:hypothetical protein
MKRLTLLTILLVAVGLASGFALEVTPTIAISGTGTLQWGIDLDSGFTGFLNSSTADLVVTLASGSDTHAGTDGWYGSITLADFALATTAGAWTNTIPAVTAKIVGMGGKVAIGVFGAPDLALDFVAAIEADADAADSVVDDESALDVGVDYGMYGTYLSYMLSDAFMVGFEVVSEDDWTLNAAQAYAFALNVQAKFAPLTIDAGVNYGMNYAANPIGFGVKVAADTAMVDGWVGFDGSLDGGFLFDVGAGATITLMETVTAAVSVVYGTAFDDLDVKFVFTEPAAKGLVDNLDATLTAYVLDIAGVAGLEYEVIFAGGYKAGVLYPHFSVTYGDANDAAAMMTAMVGIAIDPLIPLTKLEIHWTSGDLLAATPVMGTIVAGVTVTY